MDTVYTVSQINGYLKRLLDEDVQLVSIFVKGEISNFIHHQKTGHFYFSLKDGRASIKCIMFAGNARHLRFRPENGMNVILFGSVKLFERDGVCQIYCADMQPDGIGALYLAFEQLKVKLAQQGLFDPEHKRPLPTLPKRIGVVTSKNGAALQDICNILSRRYPLGELVLIPALVQGEGAPQSICEGISRAQALHLDVLIVGRGGGSLEDLWAFNDEAVAWAIYRSKVPVISAVGHEVDTTISDYVADLRAPTPSAAAELAAPDLKSLQAALSQTRKHLDAAVLKLVADSENRLSVFALKLQSLSPDRMLKMEEDRLNHLKARLSRSGEALLEGPSGKLQSAAAILLALSPLKVLSRGYTIVYSGPDTKGNVISKKSLVKPGDTLTLRFADGTAKAQVQSVSPDDEG